MIVEITKDSSDIGFAFPLVGEFYKAEPYMHDGDKLTLLYKVEPETYEKSKDQYWDEPMCNEYRNNLKVVSNDCNSNIKNDIHYFDGYCQHYRIFIDKVEQGCYVKFKVYEVDEREIECIGEYELGDYSFGAHVSYKHIFLHYGNEKESDSKYHIQLSYMEDLKRWHETIYNICDMMKNDYCK